MPKGSKGEKRPADVIGGAIKVAKIATGEIDESLPEKDHWRQSGKMGAKARAETLTPEQRSKIARLAAEARWEKTD